MILSIGQLSSPIALPTLSGALTAPRTPTLHRQACFSSLGALDGKLLPRLGTRPHFVTHLVAVLPRLREPRTRVVDRCRRCSSCILDANMYVLRTLHVRISHFADDHQHHSKEVKQIRNAIGRERSQRRMASTFSVKYSRPLCFFMPRTLFTH